MVSPKSVTWRLDRIIHSGSITSRSHENDRAAGGVMTSNHRLLDPVPLMANGVVLSFITNSRHVLEQRDCIDRGCTHGTATRVIRCWLTSGDPSRVRGIIHHSEGQTASLGLPVESSVATE